MESVPKDIDPQESLAISIERADRTDLVSVRSAESAATCNYSQNGVLEK